MSQTVRLDARGISNDLQWTMRKLPFQNMRWMRPALHAVLLTGVALSGLLGCVRRELTLTSNPPGALVYLNDEEVGRTPLTREFTWYGTYDVQVRLEGHETVDTRTKVIAPWWQWVPFDLVAELFPLTDRQSFSYSLRPVNPASNDPSGLIQRGQELRGELQSSKVPATQPVK